MSTISTPTSPGSSSLGTPTSPWRSRRQYYRHQFAFDNNGDDTLTPSPLTINSVGAVDGSDYEFPLIFERVKEPRNHRCRNQQKRVIEKIGCDNVIAIKNISRMQCIRYLKDLVNTIIDSRWRWTLWTFILTYFLNWIIFGAIWMGLSRHTERVYANGTRIYVARECFVTTETFTAFFLLAVETQTTIGYGGRSVTDNCYDAILVLCLQMLASIFLNGAFLGAVYAKTVRPTKCYRTRLFSKHSVISQRDGKLCLMFRVWDINHSHIIGTKIQAYFMQRTHRTQEMEVLKNYLIDLKLESYGLLIWPLTIVHVIDEQSPLYNMSAKDLLTKRFEIIVVLTGGSESTAQTSQIRTSYMSNEILWGHRLVECTAYDDRKQSYIIDHDKFHKTISINTPLCSANHLSKLLTTLRNQINETNC